MFTVNSKSNKALVAFPPSIMDEIIIKNSERITVKNINAQKSGVVALEKD